MLVIFVIFIFYRFSSTLQDLCLRNIIACSTALSIDHIPQVFRSLIIQYALNQHSSISFATSKDDRMFIFLSSSLNLPNETILVKSFIFPAATLTHLQSISFYKSNLLTEIGSILLANSGLTSLKFLSIRTCPLVTDESLASILSVQHVLESLTLKKLNKIDGRCLRSLSSCSPFLKELRLGKLRSLRSKFLLDAFHKLSFPALAVLDVRNGPMLRWASF